MRLWNAGASWAGGGGFILVYLCLMVPLFIAMVVFALVMRSREGQMIASRLYDYVRFGWLVPQDVPLIATLRGRKALRQNAQRYGPQAEVGREGVPAQRHRAGVPARQDRPPGDRPRGAGDREVSSSTSSGSGGRVSRSRRCRRSPRPSRRQYAGCHRPPPRRPRSADPLRWVLVPVGLCRWDLVRWAGAVGPAGLPGGCTGSVGGPGIRRGIRRTGGYPPAQPGYPSGNPVYPAGPAQLPTGTPWQQGPPGGYGPYPPPQ